MAKPKTVHYYLYLINCLERGECTGLLKDNATRLMAGCPKLLKLQLSKVMILPGRMPPGVRMSQDWIAELNSRTTPLWMRLLIRFICVIQRWALQF